MTGMKTTRDDNRLNVDWQQSKLKTPLHEAVYVALDRDTVHSARHPALLHAAYGTRDQVMIQTGKENYLLLHGDRITVMNRSHHH